ncbi:hypothetical protein FLW53_15625 [Microbispora sp. SCL1-1]|uniref:hypothetical protein n=1 Tax=unclassified Microbispora TaxID=2614687 RepID=UPI00115A954E|nr:MULTISPECIES: hypothetical protein [unclassified Microbispora]NJP25598.1 hypothetical protein [Microbispora sp. CL1-1]TQS13547.1 hypothetical protein FLW53_15625 [Microbispora sp. SCL1-1]
MPGLAGRVRKVVASAGGSVVAQFVTALSSLLLQLVAARELGATGFAAFTFLSTTLVLITTLHTSWVGDSLTVLDRFESPVRAAIAASLVTSLALGAVASVILAIVLRAAAGPGALLFGGLVLLWLLEDTVRRLLSARLEFGRLATNTVVDFVVAFATLSGFWLAHALSLETMLVAMCAGSLAGVVHAVIGLPRDELRWPRLREADLQRIVPFATWRVAQAALRPLTLMVTRVAIVAMVSSAALAANEGARLLLSPALTLVYGVGAFLLPRMVRQRQAGLPLRPRLALTASIALTAVTAVTGTIATLLTKPLEPFVTGGNFPLDPITVAAWAAYSVSIAATLPVSMLATAYRHSRLVFAVRLGESVIGVGLLLALLGARPDLVKLAPFCIGIGGVVTSVILVMRLRVLRDQGAALPTERMSRVAQADS